jgi:polyhydroxyalkanoate synthase
MPGTDGISAQQARIREALERVLSRNIAGLKTLEDIAMDFGSTPKDIIHSRGTTKLYHYTPTCDEIYRVPIVLVMSLVSRYYIMDLAPGQSLVEYLVDQGFDVYLIDWGIPRPEHRHLNLDHYVGEVLPECLEKVREDSGEEEVSLVGYCLGGVLAMMHTALARPGQVRALACFTTPVDTNGMTLYKAWAESEKTAPATRRILTMRIDCVGFIREASSVLICVAANIAPTRPKQRWDSRSRGGKARS